MDTIAKACKEACTAFVGLAFISMTCAAVAQSERDLGNQSLYNYQLIWFGPFHYQKGEIIHAYDKTHSGNVDIHINLQGPDGGWTDVAWDKSGKGDVSYKMPQDGSLDIGVFNRTGHPIMSRLGVSASPPCEGVSLLGVCSGSATGTAG